MGREIILQKYINKVKPLYDYILIDTCPTLDVLTINALAAADSALIPVTPKYLDAKGLELLLKSIANIREDRSWVKVIERSPKDVRKKPKVNDDGNNEYVHINIFRKTNTFTNQTATPSTQR